MAAEAHSPQKNTHNSDPQKRRYNIVAMIIFVLGVAFSLAFWQFTHRAMLTVEKSRFEHYAVMLRELVEERIDDHIAALRGLRAFIDSSEEVTSAEWQTYIADLDIDRHFPGALGFSFIRYVPRSELQQFLAARRIDTPEFAIISSGQKPELYIVEQIEPLERNPGFLGYDLAQEEDLVQVMDDIISSGLVAISPAGSLFNDGTSSTTVLLMMPVYKTSAHVSSKNRSREDLRGWVGAPILVGEMISGYVNQLNLPIDVEILDVSSLGEPLVLYDADGRLHSQQDNARKGNGSYEMSSRATIDIANRTWILDVYALAGFSEKVAHMLPVALLCAGLLLSLLCALLVASYGRTLERAQRLARQITKELRASEERFHKMFQEHNAVMLLVNPQTQEIVDANEAACKFYDYTREQIISLSIGKINTLLADEVEDALQQVKDRRKNHFEFKHTLANGEIRDVEVYSSPIIIDGQPLLFSIIHDVTERKLAESELASYRENLESLVNEQTQTLQEAHAELLQKERLATLGRVTATVSHELRNPLATIKTALFSIEDGLEQQKLELAVRPLELAERSIDRCVAIIEELNSFARVKKLQKAEVLLDDWLKEVVTEQTIPEGINCEMNLACTTVKVAFDKDKMRQVIVNLISNAIHALHEKGSEEKNLVISTHVLDDHFEISIADNGAGMSDETKKNIFEPLYSTKGFGVGLGMVVVKNIVEQHQGTVLIESEEGSGAIVKIHLPLDA